ncbi:hypothetical protein CUJ84_pRLN1000565 (plasmid) [Rhizobium leguminosarum]|uniref:Uncharacterized protein n=1 Tax=Rhizobium leguminosarum TaxID=384 RepID=A0A2K9ZCP8_RHILE|nr:hypothetical protein CUJ84_pRLN1000565 [Rhizobium leguminosarum]
MSLVRRVAEAICSHVHNKGQDESKRRARQHIASQHFLNKCDLLLPLISPNSVIALANMEFGKWPERLAVGRGPFCRTGCYSKADLRN